ncbi:MAG: TolC family protein [Prolixibacteraceae bacterium]|nr:TolC family protein [Prolixibacteraceae bacterium]MBN2773711.1 TolC family protein [Prolixibacteraceae bacterium]
MKSAGKVFLIISGLIIFSNIYSQDTLKYYLSLNDVVNLAIEKSSAMKYQHNRNVNYYWRWKNFKTSNRPQLVLSGELPDYDKSTQAVTQPDGSVEFKQVTNLSTSARLSLNQSIPQTGTYIYASTSLYRFQDFNKDAVSYSGSPFSIGFHQPIFAVNWLKWSRKIEPLVYDEAQKDYIESTEEISLNATYRFFTYLRVQTNYNLAENNLKNSTANLEIAETKKRLGKISENDFARIRLAVLNAQKALNEASMELKNADFELKSYIGLRQDEEIELTIPTGIYLFEIDPEKALAEAKANRKESAQFERRLIEADRSLVQAKSNTGLSATLNGSYGLSNSADELGGVYEQPEKQRTLNLSLSIPVLDWGRSASAVKLAESQRDLTIYNVEKDRTDFERSVIVQVEQFGLLKDQLETAKEADKVAENGYTIALKRFQNGEISITDMNIALSERERAKRDYINSLRTYWVAYYNLRILTLYDFELGQKISHSNPLLVNP